MSKIIESNSMDVIIKYTLCKVSKQSLFYKTIRILMFRNHEFSISPMEHLNWMKQTHEFKHFEIPTGPRTLGENERTREVRCTLRRLCESIVHPITHVIIPPRPLSSCTTSLPTLNYVSPPPLSRARPMSLVHSAPVAVDRELNERVGDPRIGHAISARGYRVVRVYTTVDRLFENPETEWSVWKLRGVRAFWNSEKRLGDLGILIFPHSKSQMYRRTSNCAPRF